ncbi:MAG: hypothetical protein LBU05_05105 [Bifidobacteriaceae bacterium]|nr:hypothetical protein [Bifidobacteriaceae bacterium]
MGAVFREEVKRLRERGTSVLLSSHTMGEVEAICDRVLIINRGVVVDDGSVEDLKHLRASRVTVRFSGGAPDLAMVPTAKVIEASGNHVVVDVVGSQAGLFAALRDCVVESAMTQTPSLEEVFLSYYDDVVTGQLDPAPRKATRSESVDDGPG